MSPRVTVVIPAHQASSCIGASLSSALWQSYKDIEVVVVDDGSTDSTAAIVEAMDGPVRLVRQSNRGVGAARNRGIHAASSELIAFCDADDVLFPNHLQTLVDLYDDAPAGEWIVTANAYWLFPGGIRLGQTRHKGKFPKPPEQRMAILEQNFVSTMSLFPRQLVEQVGPIADDLRLAEDWEFWMRAIFAGYRLIHQAKPSALYRWNPGSLSGEIEAMDAAVREVLQRARTVLELRDHERAFVDERLAGIDPRVLGRAGDGLLRAARYREASQTYCRAATQMQSEPRLVWKARVLGVAPNLVGPVLRRRQLRFEESVGFNSGMVR